MNTQPTDQYDPDSFDWGEENSPGIPIADLPVDLHSHIMSASLADHEETFGWQWLKKENLTSRAKKLFNVKYLVTDPAKRTWVEENWPEYVFNWDAATKHHDHPVSHLARELNELELTSDFVKNGEVWIDLFGNTGLNSKYKRNCFNLIGKNTPKDYIRYQNPGVRDVFFDIEKDIDKLSDRNSILGRINHVTCSHALYYIPMETIAEIVKFPQRKLHALVHRHEFSSGSLNFGELKYSISQEGRVEQENALTGEKYSHPSLEALFHQSSAKTSKGGVAWTIRAAGGDSFFVDFVGCPVEVCDDFKSLHELAKSSTYVTETAGVSVHSMLHWTWTTYRKGNSLVELQDVDLFNKLRRYVAGKARTPRLMTEVTNYARRLTNKADIISIHGGGAHDVNLGDFIDYVHASFYVDVRHELESAISFQKQNAVMVKALNAYYEQGTVPTDFVQLTKCVVKSASVIAPLVSSAVSSATPLVVSGAEAVSLAAVKSWDFLSPLEGTVFDTSPKPSPEQRVKPIHRAFKW